MRICIRYRVWMLLVVSAPHSCGRHRWKTRMETLRASRAHAFTGIFHPGRLGLNPAAIPAVACLSTASYGEMIAIIGRIDCL